MDELTALDESHELDELGELDKLDELVKPELCWFEVREKENQHRLVLNF